MRYLDARKAGGNDQKDSLLPVGENKMQRGNRLDQGGDPRDLVSSTRPMGSGSAAKALAKELNVDIATVTGTGPNGSVTEKDIRAAARKAPEPK
jgi:pyruvate/2-oxoglutarate dehydrogenase complex dihydrolipoamide acyltransferase (E2) component